jgi:hypothetical protein
MRQVREDLRDHLWLLDARNDFELAATAQWPKPSLLQALSRFLLYCFRLRLGLPVQ